MDTITHDVFNPTPPVILNGITLTPAYRTVGRVNGTVASTSYLSGDGLKVSVTPATSGQGMDARP